MIYHFVALMQLLLFVTLNVWIILLLSFAHVLLQEEHDLTTLSIKILLYTSAIIMWILIWFIYGWFWAPGTRWFPTRDRLSRLLPPSIANANMSKCRRKLCFIDLEFSDQCQYSSHPKTGGSSSSYSPFQLLQLTQRSPLPFHHNLPRSIHRHFLRFLCIF
jgi:hypothetical protein